MSTTSAPAEVLGRHVWSELMTTDTKGAEAFYKKVIGWTAEPFTGSPMPYVQFKRAGGSGVAGLMEKPAEIKMPPFWAIYIAVPDLGEALARIKKLGGSELSEVIPVKGVGHLQMVKDPQGAGFYIMQPESRDNPPDHDPVVGEASWLELMTTDWRGALSFYQQLFGWQPGDAMEMGEMGTYQIFNRGSRRIGGMMNKPKHLAEVPPNWQVYFLVDDIDAAVTRITQNGGKVVHGPAEVSGGDKIVNATDPQGGHFALHAKAKK
jgi:predicted enzyme related to lactoylglutathione lyase